MKKSNFSKPAAQKNPVKKSQKRKGNDGVADKPGGEDFLHEVEKSIRFQAHLLNTVEQSVIATNLDGVVTYWNNYAEKLYGWTSKEATGRNIIDLTTPQIMTEQAADIMNRLRRGESWAGEFLVRRLDGSTFPAHVINSPIEDDAGNLIGVVGVSIDVSERKQAEEQIRIVSEQLAQQARIFNTTLSAIADFAYIFDCQGRFIYANQPLLDLLGLTIEEITGKNFYELPYPKDLAERLQNQIKQVFETKQIVVDETPYTNPAGFKGYYEYIFSPVTGADGTVEAVAGSTRNTTDRRIAEENLRQSEERFRLLVESVTDYAIFIVSEDNLVNSWNAGAEKVFGFPEKDIIGKSGAILFTPEDRAKGVPEKEIKTAATHGRADDERWHIRQDNSRFYASGVMMPLKNNKGFVKIARDMTDKILVENALRDKEILKRMVGAQEEERKRIARDLHDQLGQQLVALKLKLEAAGKLCEQEEVCGQIDQARLLTKHINDSVDFLAWELRPAALDDLGLPAALEVYIKEWSRLSGIVTEFYTAGMKKVQFAPDTETNLYRITQEALNNALKHARPTQVNVMLERRDTAVILIIEDDGVGFDVESIFNSSQGLGLTGMRERIALIGGSLDIESAPGQGTTIFARAPIKA